MNIFKNIAPYSSDSLWECINKDVSSLLNSKQQVVQINETNNEILPDNKGNFINKNGEFSGYIELKNISDKYVNIEKAKQTNLERYGHINTFQNYTGANPFSLPQVQVKIKKGTLIQNLSNMFYVLFNN